MARFDTKNFIEQNRAKTPRSKINQARERFAKKKGFDSFDLYQRAEIEISIDKGVLATEPFLMNFWLCMDCGVNTQDLEEYYMLDWELWDSIEAAMLDDGAMTNPWRAILCIGCVEARLGRELVSKDFTDCPLNRVGDHHSLRLRDRLRRV